MVRFLKAINTFDKVTDCIPVVSTVKNIGILLYQLVHKVNKVANPVNTSWKDDIKIHVLSKDSFMSKVCIVPIIGNLTALVMYVKYALAKAKGMFVLGGPMGYLAEASRQWNAGAKKHGYEITALYLARNPDRSEKSLGKALSFAARANSPEVFELILDSRSDWSRDSIASALRSVKRVDDATLILDSYKSRITKEDTGSILRWHAYSYAEDNAAHVKLLLDTLPDLCEEAVGSSLEIAAGRKNADATIALLLERFPTIDQTHIDIALKKAVQEGSKTQVELLLAHSSGSNVGVALEAAACKGDVELVNWLFEAYADKTTHADVGRVLSAAVQTVYFSEDDKYLQIINTICKKHQDLPGTDLESALSKAAIYNHKLFGFFLNHFIEIKAENVQPLLNKAVLYSSREDFALSESWAEVAKLIRAKFPDIKNSQELP